MNPLLNPSTYVDDFRNTILQIIVCVHRLQTVEIHFIIYQIIIAIE